MGGNRSTWGGNPRDFQGCPGQRVRPCNRRAQTLARPKVETRSLILLLMIINVLSSGGGGEGGGGDMVMVRVQRSK